MREVTTTVYQFNELSDEAKKKAIEAWRYSIAERADEADNDDYQSCLAEMEMAFDICVSNWEVDSCSHHYRFSIVSDRFSEYEDDPKMLLRYINKVYFLIYKGKYYGNLYRGNDGEWVHKKRYSKVLRELNCPLTGMWVDYAAEEAMKNAFEYVRNGKTIREFLDDMLNKFFSCWEDDMYHHLSDEYVEEEIINNGYEFLEDGSRY